MNPFANKDTRSEEMAEARQVRSGKMSPAQYAAMEKAEGDHKETKSQLQSKGKQLATGKLSAAEYGKQSKEGMHKMPNGKMMKNSDMKKKPGVMAKAMGLMK